MKINKKDIMAIIPFMGMIATINENLNTLDEELSRVFKTKKNLDELDDNELVEVFNILREYV